MNAPSTFRLDRRALARAFDLASTSYDGHAQLQREVREELLARLPFFKLAPRRVVDLGCGTGEGAAALRRQFRRAETIAIDLAPGMLRQARGRSRPWRRFARVCADAEALPLASGSVDLVFSSLMLQWCEQPQAALAEISRVLRPDGLLLFSTLGPQTLDELRSAWRAVDATPHVSEFIDLPQLSMLMVRPAWLNRCSIPISWCATTQTPLALMRELKGSAPAMRPATVSAGCLVGPRCARLPPPMNRCGRPLAFQPRSKSFTAPPSAPEPSTHQRAARPLIPLSAIRRTRRA